jgi:vanillate O-demethylase ferredoxin subunit
MAQRDPGDWQPARLHTIRDLSPDIRLFEIAPDSGFVSPQPGSHIDITVRIGERNDVRSYSTVGPCTDGLWRIAVKCLQNSRGGSAYMWSLAAGARLTVAPPMNNFPLTAGAAEYMMIAGGIGITPIYGLALAAAQTSARVRVLYAGRRRADLVLADELRQCLGDHLHVFTSEAGDRIDLDHEIDRLGDESELYICGPINMIEAAKRAWRARGRRMENLRFETFGSSGKYAAERFVVRIPRLGREIVVPADGTMLDALEAGGVQMIAECRRGECGLCALPILSIDGLVDHRDVFFSDEEKTANTKLCTCVSRVVGAGQPGSITIDTADRSA